MNSSRTLLCGLLFSLAGLPAIAQNGSGQPANRPANQPANQPEAQPEVASGSRVVQPYQPEWSSPDIAAIAKRLTGSWRTEEPVESMQDESGNTVPVYLVISIAPAPVEGLTDTLYAEIARTDAPWQPYRRAIYQFYPYKDGLRLRTYEMTIGDTSKGVFDGMFAATEHFPDLSAENLIATIDLDLKTNGSGFTGSTPYPYPTGTGGAVEMTSTMTLDGDSLSIADRGYNAKGDIVWGAGKDGAFGFERAQGIVSSNRRDDGMVVLDYGGASGPVVSDGDQMHVHYDGFLKSGVRFDSSYDRGQAFIFAFPPGARAIAGWGIGMEGFAEGGHRKLIIPGYLGYGPNGNPRANIPGDATLYFNIDFVYLERPQAQPEAQPASND